MANANVKQLKIGNTTYNIEPYTDYLPLTGGNVSGHIYLTGAKESSSTDNTSQIVFGTSTNNYVAISSNNNALVINPTSAATTNQIVLCLDKQSSIPSGISTSSVSARGAVSAGTVSATKNISAGGNITTTGQVSGSVIEGAAINVLDGLDGPTWDIDSDGNFSTEGSLDVEGDLAIGGNVNIEYEITIPSTDSLYCTAQSSTLDEILGEKASYGHEHGNINNNGTISSTAVTSATGVLVYDSSNKIQRATKASALSIIGAAKKGSITKGRTATAKANTTALTTKAASGNTGNATPATGTATGGSTSVNIPTYSYSNYTLTIKDQNVSVCTTSHTHTVDSHNHSLGNHTHAIDAHTHSVSSHSHEQQ